MSNEATKEHSSKRDGRPNKPKNYGIAVGRSKVKARKEGFDAAIALVRENLGNKPFSLFRGAVWNEGYGEGYKDRAKELSIFLDSLTERKEGAK